MRTPKTKIITIGSGIDDTLQAVINHAQVTVGKEKAPLEIQLFVSWIYPFNPGREVWTTDLHFDELLKMVRSYADKEGFVLYCY